MMPINPITGAILGTPAAERAAAGEKTAQLKRIERNRKNTPTGDTFERSIDSADELEPIADEHQKQQPRRQQQRRKDATQAQDEDPPKLDITA